MNLEFGFENFDKVKAAFDPVVISKAMRTTITRTARKARTEVSKQIRQVYTVKAAVVKEAVSLRTQTREEETVAILTYRGGALPIDRFSTSVRTIRTSRGPRTGVSARVKKKGKRYVLARGFPLRGRDGPTMERVGDSRLPIKRVFRLSVPQMINEEVERAVSEKIAVDANIELNRNLQFFQDRAAR